MELNIGRRLFPVQRTISCRTGNDTVLYSAIEDGQVTDRELLTTAKILKRETKASVVSKNGGKAKAKEAAAEKNGGKRERKSPNEVRGRGTSPVVKTVATSTTVMEMKSRRL